MPGIFSWSALMRGFIILVPLLFLFEFFYGSVQTNLEATLSYNNIRLPFLTRISNATNSPPESVNNNTMLQMLISKISNSSVGTKQAENATYTKNPVLNESVSVSDGLTFSSELIVSTVMPHAAPSTLKPFCPEEPTPIAGRIPVVTDIVPRIYELEREFYWLRPGGHWRPHTCVAQKSVALIIPFRCRAEHLLIFLKHMHPFLKRQQLDYTIYIVEQNDGGPFNRAMLMNIGFKEALRRRNYDCFIFHDIDLLPEDDRNLYTCPNQPRHMSVAVNTLNYKLPYSRIFGGVSAITREHFELLNGFSNSFWGWGGEDDDMSNRIAYHKLTISRYPITIARYTMLTHKKDKANPNRYNMLKLGKTKFKTDGLNSLRYSIANTKQKLLYTWILASIEKE